MQKHKTKKLEKNEELSRNHTHRIKYRKRIQEDKEHTHEVQQYLKDKNAGRTI